MSKTTRNLLLAALALAVVLPLSIDAVRGGGESSAASIDVLADRIGVDEDGLVLADRIGVDEDGLVLADRIGVDEDGLVLADRIGVDEDGWALV
jgi:hypothetical protein